MCVTGMIAASVGGSLISAGAASKAANAQKDAAAQQTALQGRIYDETVQRFDPFYNDGLLAQEALMYELGLGDAPMMGATPLEITTLPGARGNIRSYDDEGLNLMLTRALDPRRPDRFQVGDEIFDTYDAAQQYARENATGGTQYQGYQLEPGYQFQIDEGINALNQSAASRGQLNSSWAMNNAQRLGQGIADTGRNNYLNRLASAAAGGQSAAGNQAQAGQAYASGASNALANMGNAQAAGYIGVGNAINSGIQNGLGIWQYQNALAGNQSLFGGNSWG